MPFYVYKESVTKECIEVIIGTGRHNMNIPDIQEVKLKQDRVRAYLKESGYETMIIGRQDNFAWFTDGGNNKVICSEVGFSILVITQSHTSLVAQVMDGRRVMEEELIGLDIEYVPLHWYEASREEKAMKMVEGKRVISDIFIQGTDYLPRDIYKLHYPLTDKELQKLRWLGITTEEILWQVANEIKPDMTEHEIEAMFLYAYGKKNIQCDVLLIGSDERIFKYRHPNPSDKKVDKYVLLHPAVKKWGLHANVTRMVYFGDSLPMEIDKKYNAVNQIQAAVMSMCEPGIRFESILQEQKRLYKELGFEEEWRNHYQGGITGYLVCDPTLSMNTKEEVQVNQAFDWFITITGAKVEELSICLEKGFEIPSVAGFWPTKSYSHGKKEFSLPAILTR